MAERRPLVIVGGRQQELPTGDTLPMPGGSANPFHPGFASGQRHSTPHTGFNGATAAFTADIIYYVPFFVPNDCSVASLSINVATGAAGSTVEQGIYTNANGPGTLIASAGTVDTSGTWIKTATFGTPQALTAGWYWLAYVATGGAPTVNYLAGYGSTAGNQSLHNWQMGYGSNSYAYKQMTEAGGTLPATASAAGATAGANGVPNIMVGIN